MIAPSSKGRVTSSEAFSGGKISEMSKPTELFEVRNSDWIIRETEPGVYELVKGAKKIRGLSKRQLASLAGVVAEFDRHLKESGTS